MFTLYMWSLGLERIIFTRSHSSSMTWTKRMFMEEMRKEQTGKSSRRQDLQDLAMNYEGQELARCLQVDEYWKDFLRSMSEGMQVIELIRQREGIQF